MIPLFVKNAYSHEPIFKHSRVVYSAYENNFDMPIAENFVQKAAINGLNPEDLDPYMENGILKVDKGALFYADAAIRGSSTLTEEVENILDNMTKPVLDHQSSESYLTSYIEFYNHLLTESIVE
jgi:starch synthase